MRQRVPLSFFLVLWMLAKDPGREKKNRGEFLRAQRRVGVCPGTRFQEGQLIQPRRQECPAQTRAEPVDLFPCVAATPAASHALPRTAFAAWNDYVCWGCAVTPSVCEAAVARVARNNPPGICPSSVRIRTTLKPKLR